LNQYHAGDLLSAFVIYANNQKKNDRHAIAYKIGMIDSHAGTLATYSDRKRADLLAQLFGMVNVNNIARLIQSEYTANELAKILTKHRNNSEAIKARSCAIFDAIIEKNNQTTATIPAVDFYENEGQFFEYTHTNGKTYTGQIYNDTPPASLRVSWDTFGPFEPFADWEEAENFILSKITQ
jgi:hypothetical protein